MRRKEKATFYGTKLEELCCDEMRLDSRSEMRLLFSEEAQVTQWVEIKEFDDLMRCCRVSEISPHLTLFGFYLTLLYLIPTLFLNDLISLNLISYNLISSFF